MEFFIVETTFREDKSSRITICFIQKITWIEFGKHCVVHILMDI